MNPVAETLTGWNSEAAENLPLGHVFHIVTAQTGKRVANPVKLVLETGKIHGLANHTQLISKNGQEYHITVSAAPIQAEDGQNRGVVLVFRDVSEDYRMQEALRTNPGML